MEALPGADSSWTGGRERSSGPGSHRHRRDPPQLRLGRAGGTSDLHLFEGDEGKKVIASTPLGRLGTPADIARVFVFLALLDSDYITGQLLAVDGGYLAQGLSS